MAIVPALFELHVSASTYSPCPTLTGRQRLCFAVAGGMLVVLLLLARLLQPDPSGQGTHQQLGLPPCTILTVFHIRCPACGMTTSWAHFTRGHWWRAWRCNAGGFVLAAMGAVVAPWLIGSACKGRWLVRQPAEWIVLSMCTIALLVTVTDWLIRIFPGAGS